MTLDVEFARMLAAAELLSAGSPLVFTYDRDGWSIHNGAAVDPFAGAPLADDDYEIPRHRPNVELRPCGTRAAYLRHKVHGEPIDRACIEGNRREERENKRRWYAQQRTKKAANQSPLVAVLDGHNEMDDAQIYHLPVTGAAS